MTSVSRFKLAHVSSDAVFPAETLKLFAVNKGEHCVVVVTSGSVRIIHAAKEQADYAPKLPYLSRQLSNLHRHFATVPAHGLTFTQQRMFDAGMVILGQIEPRSVAVDATWPPKVIAGPDDYAICAYTVLPLPVYQKGQDTVGHSIRYQQLCMALPQTPPGVSPYIRPMRPVPFHHMGAKTSYSSMLWQQAHDEVLTNGRRDLLLFGYYNPWSQSSPLCQVISPTVVRQHFAEDEL